ncbi:MAG: hypothetical protein HY225_01425 [Candidatus Vogelbacteria bacterium]|nr:hypothetical protein [Candidatus Vogelbacteria bacterium]
MEVLSKLFGSGDRVKIMRLFILNANASFTTKEVLERSKVFQAPGKRELNVLHEVGLIKQKTLHVEGSRKRKISVSAWFLNTAFPFLAALKQLLFNTELFKKEEIIRRLKGSGRVKVIITAGIFINDEDSRADLLIVGDELRKSTIEKTIKSMEAEIGRELSYGVFETDDFRYRVSVCDKFIRDILDYSHKKILNKLEDAF